MGRGGLADTGDSVPGCARQQQAQGSTEAARKFLNQFPDEALVSEAQQQALALGQAGSIPGENAEAWRK